MRNRNWRLRKTWFTLWRSPLTHTKFDAHVEPAVNAALLTHDQYEALTQEQHTVEEWNVILLVLSKGYFATASGYNGIKNRASKASVFSKAFNPRKRLKFREDETKYVFEGNDFAVDAEVRANLRSASSVDADEGAEVTPEAWSIMCQYINVLAEQLPFLQEVIVRSWQISAEGSPLVEDKVGAVKAELGNGAEAPGGSPCVNVWSGVATALDNSQAGSNMLGKITQQVKNTAVAMNQVTDPGYWVGGK
jgi:hypothetical protein